MHAHNTHTHTPTHTMGYSKDTRRQFLQHDREGLIQTIHLNKKLDIDSLPFPSLD